LYRRTLGTPWAETQATARLGAVDPSVINGVTYTYALQAESGAGRGEVSASKATFSALSSAADAPTGITAQAGSTCVTLSWPPVSGAGYYGVFYATSPGGPYGSGAVTADG